MHTVSRLFQKFVPENYNLSLNLLRKERVFKGIVTINGASTKNAKDMSLHAHELTIESVTFDGKKADFLNGENDELVITHPDFAPGKHVLVIAFSGKITDAMHGLYPCYYEHDGVKKELLATQFESHFAREVFPCIDEPEAKATFDLSLTTEKDVITLSNTPILSQKEENGQLVTTFETTPRMSSYLLAWVVGELQKESATTKSGVEVNVWATPAQPASSLSFALDIATRTIDFFDEYYGTPYPLKKSDHVALPDFSSGAMENWGLITYREVALLADPKTASLGNKHYLATVITHELSHQWFGNLVTMKWWNDLWLNESFANIMEYIAVDALHPEWEIWLDHASLDVLSALRRDSLEGVQAIRSDVSHPDEISALFDPSIVYAKGGRLIRMLQTFIGQDAFRAGLKTYFKKYAYQNTEAKDFWNCMSEASGQDINSFMNEWIDKSGYPVLHVTQDGDNVHLTQEQFFIGPHEPSDKLWPIPLNSTSSDMPKVFDQKEVTVTRTNTTPLRFNTGSTAHFITHYSPELLKQIIDSLKNLPDIDRLQFLHEQTLLAQAGIISTAELIPLLDHFKNETVEAVWGIVSIALNELKKFIEGDDAAEKKHKALAGSLAKKQYERLGWDEKKNEPEADTKLRSLIISWILYSDHPEALKKAQELYESTAVKDLNPELRTSIMASVIRQSKDEKIFDALLKEHQGTNSSELQEDIAAALTSTKNPELIDRLIVIFKDKSIVRPQDFPRWFVWTIRNRFGREKAWEWIRQDWSWIEERFKGDPHFDSIPRYVASSLMTETQLEEFKTFFTPLKKEPVLKRNIDIGIGELVGRVALIKRDTDGVRKALLDL